MARLIKKNAIKILQRLIEQIEPLRKLDRNSQAFLRWQRDTLTALTNIFGEESTNVKDFAAILYFDARSGTTSSADYQRGLDGAKFILQSASYEVQDYWEDEEKVE